MTIVHADFSKLYRGDEHAWNEDDIEWKANDGGNRQVIE